MKEPSEKQVKCANWISGVLAIGLPNEFTAKAYWEYVSTYIKQAQERQESIRRRYYRDFDTRSRESSEEYRMKEWRRQREADWKATHLSSGAYTEYILNGGQPHSWYHGSTEEYRKYLRSLGCKTYAEQRESTERGLEAIRGDADFWY